MLKVKFIHLITPDSYEYSSFLFLKGVSTALAIIALDLWILASFYGAFNQNFDQQG